MSNRVGILYPGYAAERDYSLLNEMLGEPVFAVVHTSIGEDAHREDARLDMGAPERLRNGALRRAGCESPAPCGRARAGASCFGWEGARRQVAAVEEVLGAPVSSTSLVFVEVIRDLGANASRSPPPTRTTSAAGSSSSSAMRACSRCASAAAA